MINKNIELIALVYKSVPYTKHIISELANTKGPDGWTVSFRIIANDPTKEVLDYLKEWSSEIVEGSFDLYNDPKPDDYYLNRVYRCWNYGGFTSKYDNICFINSDMMFSENWLVNLLKNHDGIKIPCSRLVESGKLASLWHAISRDFGRHVNSLDREAWIEYASSISKDIAIYGGLFMPCIFETKRFVESLGYPEGNIYNDGQGTLNGPVIQSGDDWYFRKLEKDYGMKHMTVYDSLVYHIQEGEMHSND